MRTLYYISTLILFILLIVVVSSVNTQTINWAPIPYSGYKIPYGTYAMREMMDDMFSEVKLSRNSIREIYESGEPVNGIIAVCNYFEAGETTQMEIEQILELSAGGANILIAARTIDFRLLDTLGTDMSYILMDVERSNDSTRASRTKFSLGDFFNTDTLHIKTSLREYPGDHAMSMDDIDHYFSKLDSSRTSVLATVRGKPIAIQVRTGGGSVILVSSPFIFSNIYMVQGGNHNLMPYFMSFVPGDEVHWTEYYEVGLGDSKTPLRYILSQDPLKWAMYTLLLTLILFVVLEMKRKQRAIPVLKTPANDSLQFIGTVGNLYYERRDNKSIADKRIQFFLDYLRTNFLMSTRDLDDLFIRTLSRKSKMDMKEVEKLTDKLRYVEKSTEISDELLTSLSNTLDKFYRSNYGK